MALRMGRSLSGSPFTFTILNLSSMILVTVVAFDTFSLAMSVTVFITYSRLIDTELVQGSTDLIRCLWGRGPPLGLHAKLWAEFKFWKNCNFLAIHNPKSLQYASLPGLVARARVHVGGRARGQVHWSLLIGRHYLLSLLIGQHSLLWSLLIGYQGAESQHGDGEGGHQRKWSCCQGWECLYGEGKLA